MHDLLAVIVWVLKCDYEAFMAADDSKHNVKFVFCLFVVGYTAHSWSYSSCSVDNEFFILAVQQVSRQ
jgi:hypothetical protein